jgi:hypothetical protein
MAWPPFNKSLLPSWLKYSVLGEKLQSVVLTTYGRIWLLIAKEDYIPLLFKNILTFMTKCFNPFRLCLMAKAAYLKTAGARTGWPRHGKK